MIEKISAKTIEARNFSLVDNKGNQRCLISAGSVTKKSANEVWINLYDKDGNAMISLTVDESGASISMSDHFGANSIGLKASEVGNAITLRDVNESSRVRIGGQGAKEVTFFDEHGSPILIWDGINQTKVVRKE